MIYKLNPDHRVKRILGDIERTKKKTVQDLRIYDLIFDGSKPIAPATGAYIFYSNSGKCLYVGKNSSKKFAERIPEHFVLTADAWFNTLLKKMVKNKKAATLITAAKELMSCQLLIIPIEENLPIQRIESFFRRVLKPAMNSYTENTGNILISKQIHQNLNKPLKNVLKFL